jgi:hypothetical protein
MAGSSGPVMSSPTSPTSASQDTQWWSGITENLRGHAKSFQPPVEEEALSCLLQNCVVVCVDHVNSLIDVDAEGT